METYVTGDLDPAVSGLHLVSLNLLKTDTNEVTATLIRHILEVWCLGHCRNAWRVEQDRARLCIFFSSDRDMVMFKLSPEWDSLEERRLLRAH